MEKILRPRQVAQMLGIGLSTFWLKVKVDPDFPRPIRFGRNHTGVRASDIEAYLEKKAREPYVPRSSRPIKTDESAPGQTKRTASTPML